MSNENRRVAARSLTIALGITGIVFPGTLMTVRRSCYTPGGLYAASAVRVSMGLVLILAASNFRWPRTLRALGVVMCLQGPIANLLGLEHARAILEWEAMHPLLLAGAIVALVSGGIVAFAVTKSPSRELGKLAH